MPRRNKRAQRAAGAHDDGDDEPRGAERPAPTAAEAADAVRDARLGHVRPYDEEGDSDVEFEDPFDDADDEAAALKAAALAKAQRRPGTLAAGAAAAAVDDDGDEAWVDADDDDDDDDGGGDDDDDAVVEEHDDDDDDAPMRPDVSVERRVDPRDATQVPFNEIPFIQESAIAAPRVEHRTYVPGSSAVDDHFEYDQSAYYMLHRMDVEWPCLSFDVLVDSLGFDRTSFPHKMTLVTGTQADVPSNNRLVVAHLSHLAKTMHDDESDDDDDDDDDANGNDDADDAVDDEDPQMSFRLIKHAGGINRVRSMPQEPNIVATWSDTGHVHIYDVKPYVRQLEEPGMHPQPTSDRPIQSHRHADEGYAMDWSPVVAGQFASGDCRGNIVLWHRIPAGSWVVDKSPITGHKGSVEDLQWSPAQPDVLASCSVDGTVRLWDTRTKQTGLTFNAHPSDVNVISWNKTSQNMLLTGGDDGVVKTWDFSFVKRPQMEFKWHNGPITSVEWHPSDVSCFAVAGADDMVTLWDAAVEPDDDAAASAQLGADDEALRDLPQELLFVHQGLHDPKEVHWHPQIPGALAVTSFDGFHVFRPCNF